MKIGILTYHRSHNYGALLQGIALREVLVRAGHQVTYIDYWPTFQRHRYLLFSWNWMMKTQKGLPKKLKYIKSCIANYKYRKRRNMVFSVFISEYILPYVSSQSDSYDLVIHGSDQIWRKQPEINSYDPVYFGNNNIKARKKITYAASMGFLPNRDKDISILKNYLSYLDCITVREQNLLEFVSSLGYTARLVLDPTLLISSTHWKDFFKIKSVKKSYVFYYQLKDTFDIDKIRKFSEIHNCDLKIVSGKDRNIYASGNVDSVEDPKFFLELLSNANYVFTSSFHGLTFALLFHKQFFASFNKLDRAYSLLSSLGLLDRLIEPKDDFPYEDVEIDYNYVDDKLKILREESLSYLREQCDF